jgi:hypothetical protein
MGAGPSRVRKPRVRQLISLARPLHIDRLILLGYYEKAETSDFVDSGTHCRV